MQFDEDQKYFCIDWNDLETQLLIFRFLPWNILNPAK
jgi:hypothetical protein